MPHSTPARHERARLAVARLFLLHPLFVRTGVKLVPRSHPYRTFLESRLDLLDEITRETLKTRGRNLTLPGLSALLVLETLL